MAAKPPRREIWHPVPFLPAEAYAAKAFDQGKATEHQQLLLRDWLIRASRMKDEIFVPEMDDVRSYLLGRRSIGLQYGALLTWRPPETKGE